MLRANTFKRTKNSNVVILLKLNDWHVSSGHLHVFIGNLSTYSTISWLFATENNVALLEGGGHNRTSFTGPYAKCYDIEYRGVSVEQRKVNIH